MLLRSWVVGMHAMVVVSLTLGLQQGVDLSLIRPFNDVSLNASDSNNSSIFPQISAHPISFSNLNQNSSRLGHGKYECDKSRFGRPSAESCDDAYSWMVRGKEVLKFGDRSAPITPDVPLPLRYSSST